MAYDGLNKYMGAAAKIGRNPVSEADSYGNEKLIRKWTKSVFVFFNFMGTRMVQIRIAKSV